MTPSPMYDDEAVHHLNAIAAHVDPKNAVEKQAIRKLETLDTNPDKKLGWFSGKGPSAKLVLSLAAAAIAAGGAYYGYKYKGGDKAIRKLIQTISEYSGATKDKIMDAYKLQMFGSTIPDVYGYADVKGTPVRFKNIPPQYAEQLFQWQPPMKLT